MHLAFRPKSSYAYNVAHTLANFALGNLGGIRVLVVVVGVLIGATITGPA